MASIYGDWFHSRSSSNIDELITVRALVNESIKPKYAGLLWSGGRQSNPILYEYALSQSVQPSTMQTKIRAMVRYGFIKNGNTLPLVWTRLGSLWNDLFTLGNYQAAKEIYCLTLTISLAVYAFNNTKKQYSLNPSLGDVPLKFLLNNLNNNSISLDILHALIDGNTNRVGENFSYWKSDLLNSGLFFEENEQLIYTGKYQNLKEDIQKFIPDTTLSENEWDEIRDNPLIEISPFKESIKEIFEEIIQAENLEESVIGDLFTEPIVDMISEQENTIIPETDILSLETRYANSNRRVRNNLWGTRIKQRYFNRCVIPNCDVNGKIFVESAHIKPDSVTEEGLPHRSHILNGVCLCRICHIAFEKGLFSFTDDARIITSSKFSEIPNQKLKTVIISSSNQPIKTSIDNRQPLEEFLKYHRENIFKP